MTAVTPRRATFLGRLMDEGAETHDIHGLILGRAQTGIAAFG
jgi:hypothetical protein